MDWYDYDELEFPMLVHLIRVYTSLSPEVTGRIDSLAFSKGITRSQFLRILIYDALREYD